MSTAVPAPAATTTSGVSGTLRAVYQFNVGASVDLAGAEALLGAFQPSRGKLQTSRRIPKDFGYGDDPPVRIMIHQTEGASGHFEVATTAQLDGHGFVVTEVTFYEFGVMEVVLESKFTNLALDKLIRLRAMIADEDKSEPIYQTAERLMLELAGIIDNAIVDRFQEVTTEDYAVVVISNARASDDPTGSKLPFDPAAFVALHRAQISQLIQGEAKQHSPAQIEFLTGAQGQLSFYQDCVFFVSYYSTVIIGLEDPDVSDVVLIVCAQGLELQYLTDLAEKYTAETRRLVGQQEVTPAHYNRIQAFILELGARLLTVKNAVNLIGDPDLKRLFVLTIQQLDVRDPLEELGQTVDNMSGILNTETNIGMSREVVKYDRWILIFVIVSCLLSLLYFIR